MECEMYKKMEAVVSQLKYALDIALDFIEEIEQTIEFEEWIVDTHEEGLMNWKRYLEERQQVKASHKAQAAADSVEAYNELPPLRRD